MTLIKNPGYPIFIASMYRVGIPLKIGEQLTYLMAAASVASCVWVVIRRVALTLVVFVVLALDPVNFSLYDARVYRDGWYASISLLFIATFFLAGYGAIARGRMRWLLPIAALAGFSGAAFWLGREEGTWILPTVLVIALGLPLCRFATSRTSKPQSRHEHSAARLALTWAVVGVAMIAPVAAASRENARHYGSALTNDLATGAFARAYADWRRVEAGAPTGTTPLVRSQREAVYKVSSAARELEPYLEDNRSHWLRASCRIFLMPSKPCGELQGTLVIFALRDAATQAGHFLSEPEVQRFFGELDSQIRAACESGQLKCTASLPTELQPIQRFAPGPFFSYLWHWGALSLTSTYLDDSPTITKQLDQGSWNLAAGMVSGLPANQASADQQMQLFTSHDWQYRLLAGLYRVLLPCLIALALVGITIPIIRPCWPQSALSVLTGAFLVGAVSRLAFVALLNTTLFPTAGSDVRYLLPMHAFLIAFGVVGAAQFFDAHWMKLGGTRFRRSGQEVLESPGADMSRTQEQSK